MKQALILINLDRSAAVCEKRAVSTSLRPFVFGYRSKGLDKRARMSFTNEQVVSNALVRRLLSGGVLLRTRVPAGCLFSG